MPNIITRYLTAEITKSSSATVLILFIILMSNALGRVLSEISDGDIPHQALWPVLLAQSVNIFTLLLPVGFFFGIVFAFGRLYKDHEMVVMSSCGMGYRHFYKPVLLILVPISRGGNHHGGLGGLEDLHLILPYSHRLDENDIPAHGIEDVNHGAG